MGSTFAEAEDFLFTEDDENIQHFIWEIQKVAYKIFLTRLLFEQDIYRENTVHAYIYNCFSLFLERENENASDQIR